MNSKIQRTMEAYNKNSHRFAEKFMHYDSYVSQIEKFIEYLKDDFCLLDIGCGPGNVSKQICESKKVKITGIDLSEKMVELAKQNVPSGDFCIQDSRTADFPDESFHAIILSFSIVHLETEEAELLLKNVAKWLKPGGYVYISFMEGKQPGFETTSFSQQELYFNYFQESAVKKVLEDNKIDCIYSAKQDYPEPDGSMTTDVFLFGCK